MSNSSDTVVIDTDVVSYLLKRDTRASLYKNDLIGKQPIISFMTLAELKFWAINKNWGDKRMAAMMEHLRHFIIYPVDMRLIDFWAQLIADGRKAGRTISTNDAWIAATALSEGVPLITHNKKDFEWIQNLTIISHSGEAVS